MVRTFETVTLSGAYILATKELQILVQTHSDFELGVIENVCKEMLASEILNHTIHLNSGVFLFFHRDKTEVRFIAGSDKDYLQLQNLLKFQNQKIVDALISTIVDRVESEDKKTLTDQELIHNSLFPALSHFTDVYSDVEVFFEPLEAPGGDFYWIKNYQHKSLVIVGDCTGHGMQGAMIAMSIMTLLKQFYSLPPISIKNSIIEFYQRMEALLEEKIGVIDAELGMLWKDTRTGKTEYIGSGVNLIVKNQKGTSIHSTRKVKTIKGNQESIKLNLKKGDQLFLYTDGITDQFDKMDRRKLGSKALLEMVDAIDSPIRIKKFKDSFDKYRKKTKSLDDQTIILLTV